MYDEDRTEVIEDPRAGLQDTQHFAKSGVEVDQVPDTKGDDRA